jgi:hypothetical protein
VESSAAPHDDLLASQHLVCRAFPCGRRQRRHRGAPELSHTLLSLVSRHACVLVRPQRDSPDVAWVPLRLSLSTEHRSIGYSNCFRHTISPRSDIRRVTAMQACTVDSPLALQFGSFAVAPQTQPAVQLPLSAPAV